MLQPRTYQKAPVGHLCALALRPSFWEQLARLPGMPLVIAEEDEAAQILLAASTGGTAVESSRHRKSPFVRAIQKLNTVVEPTTSVVRPQRVVD